jgi:chromosome segregation ATPase
MRADIEVLLKELDEARATNADLEDAMLMAQAKSAQAAERLQRAEKQLRAKSSHKLIKRQGIRSAAAEEETIETLQARNAELKMARDRLIESLDLQAADVDRLTQENGALADAVTAAQDLGSRLEAQVQEALAQNRHLRGILEEGAEWAAMPMADGPVSSLEERCQQLESTLLGTQARCAELEGQRQALCAELSRVVNHSVTLHRLIRPTLTGVEFRLASLVQNSDRT